MTKGRIFDHVGNCLAAFDWLVLQQGLHRYNASKDLMTLKRTSTLRLSRLLVLQPETSRFLTADTRELNGAKVGSWPGREAEGVLPLCSSQASNPLRHKAEKM